MKRKLRGFISWLGLGILVLGLVVGLNLGKKVTELFNRAAYKKAEIEVEADKELGTMPRPWKNLSQGGEETSGMISKVVDQTTNLSPKYIRIDHVYDFYEVVKKENNQLVFNFDKLDKEVKSILLTGAKPFFALSYMPADLGKGVVEAPDNWQDWKELVKATIEHYSGIDKLNIADVYYEVWNEPDLFGEWKIYGGKNYLELYRQSALAAGEAQGVLPFKLGGPATTGLYKNWMESLLKLSREENLRLDFVSWHRYSLKTGDFKQDINLMNSLAKKYPELALKEKIISEWGPDSKNNTVYDNQAGAAHMVASVREMLGGVHKAFVFEIMDGKNPDGRTFWGGWGLLSHASTGLQIKPRYKALEWLDELGGKRIMLKGEGSLVKGIAARKDGQLQIYLVNYDVNNSNNNETVPIVVKNLEHGNYRVEVEKFIGQKEVSTVVINNGVWTGSVTMSPNQIARISFLK